MARTPTISVIIPTYNRAHLVGRAIRSVLAQTFRHWELLVVDDGSTDNTEEVIQGFLVDPRIGYLRHQSCSGVSAARNTGIRAARAEYIAFLDSDDEWLAEKLERQLEVFRSSPLDGLGLVLCGIYTVEDGVVSGVNTGPRRARGWFHEEALAGGFGPMTPSTWLLRRSAFSRLPLFDPTFQGLEDRDHLIRTTRLCQAAWVMEPLVRWHSGSGNQNSMNAGNGFQSRLRFMEKYAGELAQRSHLRSSLHQKAAAFCYDMGDMRGVRHHLRLSIRASPSHPKVYLLVAAAWFGKLPYGLALRFCSVVSGGRLTKRLRRRRVVAEESTSR